MRDSGKQKQKEITPPEKITLEWLFRNVSVSVWLQLGVIVVAAFTSGILVGQTTFVRELMGKAAQNAPGPTPSPPGNVADKSAAVQAPSPTPAPVVDSPGLNQAEAAIQVWVNTRSRTYHCPNTRWYGNTNEGAYLTQGQAVEEKYKPARGQVCRE